MRLPLARCLMQSKREAGQPMNAVVFRRTDCHVLGVSGEGSAGQSRLHIKTLPVQVLQSHVGQPVNAQVYRKTDSSAIMLLDAELESGHIETVQGTLYCNRQSLADIKVVLLQVCSRVSMPAASALRSWRSRGF